MENDPLYQLPEEKWSELELNLKLDWPRSILVINLLENLRRFPELHQKFNYKVYCPYGNPTFGMIATCLKNNYYEVFIHCSRDIKTFLNAIKISRIINWETVDIQFTDRRIMESVARVMRSRNVELCHLLSGDTLYMDRNIPDVQIPQNVRFGHLSLKHVPLVDSKWPHRYPGSDWYFEQLITSKLAYGLFEKETNKLMAWVFYIESGVFENFYVIDSYKNKGYGELLVKITYNIVREHKDYIYSFCVKSNHVAAALFNKVGYKIIGETFWTTFKSKTRSKI